MKPHVPTTSCHGVLPPRRTSPGPLWAPGAATGLRPRGLAESAEQQPRGPPSSHRLNWWVARLVQWKGVQFHSETNTVPKRKGGKKYSSTWCYNMCIVTDTHLEHILEKNKDESQICRCSKCALRTYVWRKSRLRTMVRTLA